MTWHDPPKNPGDTLKLMAPKDNKMPFFLLGVMDNLWCFMGIPTKMVFEAS